MLGRCSGLVAAELQAKATCLVACVTRLVAESS